MPLDGRGKSFPLWPRLDATAVWVPGYALFSIVLLFSDAAGGEPFVLLSVMQDFITSLG